MEEDSCKYIDDLSGNNNSAKFYPDDKYLKVNDNSTIAFIQDRYLLLPDQDFSSLTEFSLSVWINVTNSEISWARIIDFGDGMANYNFIIAREGTTNNLIFSIYDSNGKEMLKRFTNFFLNIHYIHLCITLESSNFNTIKVYRNNVLFNGGAFEGSVSISWFNKKYDNCYIGKSNWVNDSLWEGGITDFRMYNRKLTTDEITILYNEKINAIVNNGLFCWLCLRDYNNLSGGSTAGANIVSHFSFLDKIESEKIDNNNNIKLGLLKDNGTTIYKLGNNGGNSYRQNTENYAFVGGGGGGAGEPGYDGANLTDTYFERAGKGGDGFPCDIMGTLYYWGAGGGGSGHDYPGGKGGLGGGGGGVCTGVIDNGSTFGEGGLKGYNKGYDGIYFHVDYFDHISDLDMYNSRNGGNGGENTGSGGGGFQSSFDIGYGGNGGSGIVVVRWKTNNKMIVHYNTPLLKEPNIPKEFVIKHIYKNIIDDNKYKYFNYCIFKETGYISFPSNVICDILVVGGGGGGTGGSSAGGGGGGGGGAVVYAKNVNLYANTMYSVIVGEGGINYTEVFSNSYTRKGKTSSFGEVIIAEGGGGGGTWNDFINGGSGGCGGGAGQDHYSNQDGKFSFPYGGEVGKGSSLGGNYGVIYGNRGGDSFQKINNGDQTAGGGGGGAGEKGYIGLTWGKGGKGGDGIMINITGEEYYWGGGGGGSGTQMGGEGGLGGGGGRGVGNSYGITSSDGYNGGANTGGGGGAVNYTDSIGTSGSGGSGIVIIRWNNNPSLSPDTYSPNNKNYLHIKKIKDNDYNVFKYVEFTENTNISLKNDIICDILIVGGGGAGGNNYGGGGGAGGVVYIENKILKKGDYIINIGAGGIADNGATTVAGNNGEDSYIRKTNSAEIILSGTNDSFFAYKPSTYINYSLIYNSPIFISKSGNSTVVVNGKTFNIPYGYQVWNVPSSGSYHFIAAGARGGYSSNPEYSGRGLIVHNTVNLNKDDKIVFCIGKTPLSYSDLQGCAGGGGTFISKLTGTGSDSLFSNKNNHTLLLVAGGGGGDGSRDYATYIYDKHLIVWYLFDIEPNNGETLKNYGKGYAGDSTFYDATIITSGSKPIEKVLNKRKFNWPSGMGYDHNYIKINNSSTLLKEMLSEFTISYWQNSSSTTTSRNIAVLATSPMSTWTNSNRAVNYLTINSLFENKLLYFDFGRNQSNLTNIVSSDQSSSTNTDIDILWCFVFKHNRMKLYRNGVFLVSIDPTITDLRDIHNGSEFFIGLNSDLDYGGNSGQTYFNFNNNIIWDFRIYNKALEDHEINHFYNTNASYHDNEETGYYYITHELNNGKDATLNRDGTTARGYETIQIVSKNGGGGGGAGQSGGDGVNGNDSNFQGAGAGGGGYIGNGGNGNNTADGYCLGGNSFLNGGEGGDNIGDDLKINGGFGGGGGSWNSGGGGGGYNGGGASKNDFRTGGGGGSCYDINSSTAVQYVSWNLDIDPPNTVYNGYSLGNGFVCIENTSLSSSVFIDGIELIGRGGGGGGTVKDNNLSKDQTTYEKVDASIGGSGGGAVDSYNNIIYDGGISNQGNTYWNGSEYVYGGNKGNSIISTTTIYKGGGGGGMGGSNMYLTYYDGQDGILNSITGTEKYYAAGGGGGIDINERHSLGGSGIGGNGAILTTDVLGVNKIIINTKPATDGISNTGSGGGGGVGTLLNANTYAGSGGSGIVVIKWKQLINSLYYNNNIYEYIVFNSSQNFTFDKDTICDVLLVGGGGGGGCDIGGGGGGGAVMYVKNINIPANNYEIIIGKGGSEGENGENTTAFGGIARGGGAGANRIWGAEGLNGNDGGSGGGAKSCINSNYFNGGNSTIDITLDYGNILNKSLYKKIYGNKGGKSEIQNNQISSAGGGGAGSNGNDARSKVGLKPNGGEGIYIDILGNNSSYYGAGGGGGSYKCSGGNGGKGGGGGGGTFHTDSIYGMGGIDKNGKELGIRGGQDGKYNGGPAYENTGSGGGGGGFRGYGGKGGSGIVIIRWKKYSYINKNIDQPTINKSKRSIIFRSMYNFIYSPDAEKFDTNVIRYPISKYFKYNMVISFWLKVNIYTSPNEFTLFKSRGNYEWGVGYIFLIKNNNFNILIFSDSDNSWNTYEFNTELNFNNEFYHIVFVFIGNNIYLYINSVYKSLVTLSKIYDEKSRTRQSCNFLSFGSFVNNHFDYPNLSTKWDMKINDWKIYYTDLSDSITRQERIEELYNQNNNSSQLKQFVIENYKLMGYQFKPVTNILGTTITDISFSKLKNIRNSFVEGLTYRIYNLGDAINGGIYTAGATFSLENVKKIKTLQVRQFGTTFDIYIQNDANTKFSDNLVTSIANNQFYDFQETGDGFLISWDGYFCPLVSGEYIFYKTGANDDGYYIMFGDNVDYNTIILSASEHGTTESQFTVNLIKDNYYKFCVFLVDFGGNEYLNIGFKLNEPTATISYDFTNYVFSSIGSSIDYPATDAKTIKALTGTNRDGVYYIDIKGKSTPIYCLMHRKWDGGGWMMLMKIKSNSDGDTFGYNSKYWTDNTTTLNTSSTSREDEDAKFDTMNHVPVQDIMSVWNGTICGGDVNIDENAWILRKNNWINDHRGETFIDGCSGTSKTYYEDNNLYTQMRGYTRKIFYYTGIQDLSKRMGTAGGGKGRYGININHTNSNNSYVLKARWGFLFNNEDDFTSCDTISGIGLNFQNGSSDIRNCGAGVLGWGQEYRQYLTEVYGR